MCLAWCVPAAAGTACTEAVPSPATIAHAADTALRVVHALDARNASVALLARAGTDLSKHGLRYSHVAFVLRDHPDGRWSVVHLLNRCGTAYSGVYVQGLVNFFADGLVNQDYRIVWLRQDLADALVAALRRPKRVHEVHYNLIARFDSDQTQNSTAWVLDMLGVALGADTRHEAQQLVASLGHRPDLLHVSYAKRIMGGLFAANVDFTDHPIPTRLKGRYPVVTVRSIFRWLEERDFVAASEERLSPG